MYIHIHTYIYVYIAIKKDSKEAHPTKGQLNPAGPGLSTGEMTLSGLFTKSAVTLTLGPSGSSLTILESGHLLGYSETRVMKKVCVHIV